jgi:hypothetical protein
VEKGLHSGNGGDNDLISSASLPSASYLGHGGTDGGAPFSDNRNAGSAPEKARNSPRGMPDSSRLPDTPDTDSREAQQRFASDGDYDQSSSPSRQTSPPHRVPAGSNHQEGLLKHEANDGAPSRRGSRHGRDTTSSNSSSRSNHVPPLSAGADSPPLHLDNDGSDTEASFPSRSNSRKSPITRERAPSRDSLSSSISAELASQAEELDSSGGVELISEAKFVRATVGTPGHQGLPIRSANDRALNG